jgi:hypothetical protein
MPPEETAVPLDDEQDVEQPDSAPDDESPEVEPDSQAAESATAPPPAPPDPYQERFDRYERRIAELEASQRQLVDAGQRPQPRIPAALQKDPNTWSAQDLREYNQYTIQQEITRVTAEQQWRGQLSAATLGEGNDYDTVINKYLMPQVERSPQDYAIVQQLDPQARYMLALCHEVYAACGGNLVAAIKAIRGGAGARVAAARDIQKAVNSSAKQTALGVIRGGKQQSAGGARDPWDLSEEEFRTRVAARRNRT